MDFAVSPAVADLQARARAFLEEAVIPAEAEYARQKHAGRLWETPPVMEQLKDQARHADLWNLFFQGEGGPGLTNLEYAPVAEISGRSPWIMPEAMNCSAPDTGNMEVLAHYATAGVRDRWLPPLLAGEIRSVYS